MNCQQMNKLLIPLSVAGVMLASLFTLPRINSAPAPKDDLLDNFDLRQRVSFTMLLLVPLKEPIDLTVYNSFALSNFKMGGTK